jgi:hypothetical protein
MRRKGNGLNILMGACALAITAGLNLSTAKAEDDYPPIQAAPAEAAAPSAPKASHEATALAGTHSLTAVHVGPDHAADKPARPYFVEFRARSALSYGHTFLVHGRVGQKITAKDVIGLHPATESSMPWMIGHLIPVVSETGASDGDFEEQYVIARYRVLLTEPEYKKTLAMMRGMQRNHPVWHAVLYNCNRFVGDVAQNMGLRSPGNSLLMPKEYINTLKAVNNGRSVLSGPEPAREQTASAPKRQQTERQQTASPAKPKPAANARQEASVRAQPQPQQYTRPEN